MEPKECRHAKDLFSDRLDGELESAEAAFLEGHLGGCGDCRAEWESFEKIFLAVRELPEIDVSGSFETRLAARIRLEEKGRRRGSWWTDLARLPLPMPLGAAAIVLFAVFAFNRYSGENPGNEGSIAAGESHTAPATDVARVENTRPSFLPDGAVRGAGNVVALRYGPPRPRADLHANSRSHRPGDPVGVPLEGPYPRGYGFDGLQDDTREAAISGTVDTFQAR